MSKPKNQEDTLFKRQVLDVIKDIEIAYANADNPMTLEWYGKQDRKKLFRAGHVAAITGLAGSGTSRQLVSLMAEAAFRSPECLPVVCFCKEGAAKYITMLAIADLSDISVLNLQTGNLVDEDWPRLTQALHMLYESRILLEEVTQNPLQQIDALLGEPFPKQQTFAGIFIDDFANFSSCWLQSNPETSEHDILLYLKKLAKNHSCPLLISAHIKADESHHGYSLAPLSSIEGDGGIASICDEIFNITIKPEPLSPAKENDRRLVRIQKSRHRRLDY